MATDGQRSLIRAAGKLEIAQAAIGSAIADIDVGGEELSAGLARETIKELRRLREALKEIETTVEDGSR